ncbi:MAG: RDD family protein [Pseudomonadota bacterium]
MEHPESRVEFVGFWYRLGALLWDLLLTGLLSGVLIAILLGKNATEPWAATMTTVLANGITVSYVAAGWLLYSRTVGGWLCSQEIVRLKDGTRPRWWQMLIRLVLAMAFPPGWLLLLFNRRRRTLADLAAGTCVVADRSMRELSGAELQEHPQALQTVNWQEPRVAATEPPPNLRFPSAR